MSSNGHEINRKLSKDDDGQCETDRIRSLELESNRHVLYFSDGIMELDTDNEDVLDTNHVEFQDTFSFMSRLRNNFNRFGTNVLAGIDYVGEELASLLGITSKPDAIKELGSHNTASVNPEGGVNSNGWVNAFNNNGNEDCTHTPINSHNRNPNPGLDFFNNNGNFET